MTRIVQLHQAWHVHCPTNAQIMAADNQSDSRILWLWLVGKLAANITVCSLHNDKCFAFKLKFSIQTKPSFMFYVFCFL